MDQILNLSTWQWKQGILSTGPPWKFHHFGFGFLTMYCILFVCLFVFSSTSLLLPTHLPPPSCTCAQSCDPMDYSPPGSSVHGLIQVRILEWVAISFSKKLIFNKYEKYIDNSSLPFCTLTCTVLLSHLPIHYIYEAKQIKLKPDSALVLPYAGCCSFIS